MDLEDISKSCRACRNNQLSLYSVYETIQIDDNFVEISKLFVDFSSVEINKDDNFPKFICQECVAILKMFFKFRNQVIETQNVFIELIRMQTEIKQESMEIHDDNKSFNTNGIKTEGELDYFEFNDLHLLSNLISKPKLYVCDKCNLDFDKENEYIQHINEIGCEQKYVLDDNKESVLSSHEYINDDVDRDFDLSPKNYLEKFGKSENREARVKSNASVVVKKEQAEFQCPHCDVSYIKRRSLAMHMKKHKVKVKGEKRNIFLCDHCNKRFTQKNILVRHMITHLDKQYQCDKCNKQYSREDRLKEHQRSHHNSKPNKNHICSYCNKGFSQLCGLKDHIRIHTKETAYLCAECGKGFANSSNLRQHLLRHTGIKQFSCTYCAKAFVTKGQMKSHELTHIGAHPHTCERCGSAFTQLGSLRKHMLIHLGVKPYQCDSCDMRFTCKDHLKRHTRIHTGEKPYKCEHCERTFTQSNDLVKHKRSHLGDKLYPCSVCGVKFRLQSELKRHQLDHLEAPPAHGAPAHEPPRPHLPPPTVLPDDRITITINNCEKNGIAAGITINISPNNSELR